MTKKEYLQPTMKNIDDMEELLLVNSVNTTGLDDPIVKDNTSGDSWGDAQSRGSNIWDD